MRWLALASLLFLTSEAAAQPSPDAGLCVTTSLQLIYFGLEAPDRSLSLTENLRPPEDDMAAEPAPAPPPPAAPGGEGFGGGVPNCEPIVRPVDDAVAKQICEDASTYGLWTCHVTDDSIVIEDVRYAAPAAPPLPDDALPDDNSHGGTKN